MSVTKAPDDTMRQDAEWMRQPADARILEVCDEEGNMTPRGVSREGLIPRADVSRDYAGDRMRQLTRYGLLERLDRGLYRITDTGRSWLDGDVDAATLDPIDLE